MEEHHNLLHFFSVWMKEILEEVCDRLIGYVATHHDMPPENKNVGNLSNKLGMVAVYVAQHFV